MKIKILFAITVLLYSYSNALAFKPSYEEAKSWVSTPVSGFVENKGQLCDMNNNPAPYLMFKLQDRSTDVYITGIGLSYVFKYFEEKTQNTAAGNKEISGLPDDKFNHKNLIIHYCRADIELAGADIKKENIIQENPSADYFNYYLSHCPEGIMEVRSYGKITIKEIYPGIDWVIYNITSGGMKYDFVVHPYADPSQIKMRYIKTDIPEENEGNITITTPLGKITEEKPCGYSSGIAVNVNYNLDGNEITFQTGEYNSGETLILDFQREWATYYGGNFTDIGNSIHSDGTSVWVTGETNSTDFPLQNLSGAYNQGTYGGGYNDAFILKFNSSGVRIWATYYGGSGEDDGNSICSDDTSVWVTGITYSTNFPLQNLSGAYNQGNLGGEHYAFILKFSISGVRQWATYYGGGSDFGYSIYADSTGIWITGQTFSASFPVQTLSGAYNQGTYGGGYNDAFILKLSSAGVRQWATYYGGSGAEAGLSIQSDGTSVWITGSTRYGNFPLQNLPGAYNQATNGGMSIDAFILKFSISGVRQWATYYGGSGDDIGTSLNSDGAGVWVTGYTKSVNFPLQYLQGAYNQGTIDGNQDAFIIKFNTSGVREWATCYGGTYYNDYGNSIFSDGTSVWVTGETDCYDFPILVLPGAYNQETYGGNHDAFIIKFNTSGVRQWATYYGGNNADIGYSIQSDGNSLWATGYTKSLNFPLQSLSGAYNQETYAGGLSEAFILKFSALITGIKSISREIPEFFYLSQNYPNPFNPVTKIKFDIVNPPFNKGGQGGFVSLKVFDILGKEVETLVNEQLQPGSYEVTFDGSNLPSGIYFYKLKTDNFSDTKKLTLLK